MVRRRNMQQIKISIAKKSVPTDTINNKFVLFA